MSKLTDRRRFLKQSVAAGIATIAGTLALSDFSFSDTPPAHPDICVIKGNNPFKNTVKAVETLGGMKKFVGNQSKVGVVVNSVWERRGAYTDPNVALAVITMCLDAGVKEIYSLNFTPPRYWEYSTLSKKYREEIQRVRHVDENTEVEINNGKSLKKAAVSKKLLECDVVINIPIVKHHVGTSMTGNLKNMMGVCSRETCRFFHNGSGAKSGYDDVDFLSQCIADLNLVRTPDLCVVDATEILLTNGPAGPGEFTKPGKVIAGKKCASVDAYCSTILGHKPNDIAMIRFANEHGLGEINLKKLIIKEG